MFFCKRFGCVEMIESRINAEKYEDISNFNLQVFVAKIELSNKWFFQPDNDPKHTAKSTKKWLAENSIVQLE